MGINKLNLKGSVIVVRKLTDGETREACSCARPGYFTRRSGHHRTHPSNKAAAVVTKTVLAGVGPVFALPLSVLL